MAFSFTIQITTNKNEVKIINTSATTPGDDIYWTLKKLNDNASTFSLATPTNFSHSDVGVSALPATLQDFPSITAVSTNPQIITANSEYIIFRYTTDGLYRFDYANTGNSGSPLSQYILLEDNLKSCKKKLTKQLECIGDCVDKKYIVAQAKFEQFKNLENQIYYIWSRFVQVQTIAATLAVSGTVMKSVSELIEQATAICGNCEDTDLCSCGSTLTTTPCNCGCTTC